MKGPHLHGPPPRRDATGAICSVPMIEVCGGHKVFDGVDGGTYALRDATFGVGDGELVSVIGPSGCGKTTILQCVSGLEPIVQGRIVLDGKPVTGPRSGEIGFVFQKAVLLGWR